MSLPLAITLIVVLDAALIGLLAFVMSRARRLTPHAAPALDETPNMQLSTRPLHRRHTSSTKREHIGAETLPARS
jgi:hypothetical protein